MASPIVMPKLGQTVEEATLVNWLVEEGDTVEEGDILFEIETDKAQLEAESFYEGTVLKIIVKEGETVPVSSVVAFIGEPGDEIPEIAPPEPKPAPPAETPAPAPEAKTPAPAKFQAEVTAPAATAEPPKGRISPRARRLAREKAVDPSKATGTGPEGRITEDDLLGYLAGSAYDDIRIAPGALELARSEEVDILDLASSGGKLTVAYIEEAAAEKPVEMSRMRRTIAERLTASARDVPSFSMTVAIDVTGVFEMCKELAASGKRYAVTDLILKAVVESLGDFPAINGWTDGKMMSLRKRVGLGIAVLIEDGLVVPVVKGAHVMSTDELRDAAAELVGRARKGGILPDEMSGGTFTISKIGMAGIEDFSAIINPGQSAILAVASTNLVAAVHKGELAARRVVRMTLSADHRIVDGADAADFLKSIKAKLGNVALWKDAISQ